MISALDRDTFMVSLFLPSCRWGRQVVSIASPDGTDGLNMADRAQATSWNYYNLQSVYFDLLSTRYIRARNNKWNETRGTSVTSETSKPTIEMKSWGPSETKPPKQPKPANSIMLRHGLRLICIKSDNDHNFGKIYQNLPKFGILGKTVTLIFLQR